MSTSASATLLGVAVVASLAIQPSRAPAQQAGAEAIRIDGDDIAGVVTGASGPEAGVWVIAETTDLPTKFARIVVTDDKGQYLLPDLPKANYSIWVRGYGLVDSAKTSSAPGKILNLKAVPAPNAAAAAEYYPAIYWYSMLKIPPRTDFPGTGTGVGGNGIPATVKSQGQWLDFVKTDGCVTCHQLGDKATRTLSKELGHFDSSGAAWMRRIQSGQASSIMVNTVARFGGERATGLFGDWTDRVAAGELPFDKPARPQGIERNVVVTLWDWADPKTYLHDEISTDRRNPRLNANGLIYGSVEDSSDFVPVLDPVHNKASRLKIPVRDPATPSSAEAPILAPSPYWGAEAIWDSKTSTHNPMYDEKSHIWFTAKIRPPANPDFCKKGSDLPSAKAFPVERATRHLAMYDGKADKFTLVNTCFSTHHLQFAADANNTLWASSAGGEVVGWLNRKMFEKTGDEMKSQGWTAFILDTNGNGKRDDYVEPNQPIDPAKDKRIVSPMYGISPNPKDGSIWGSTLGFPGGLVRLSPGSNPPATALTEYYETPWDDPRAAINGYSPRGMDIDSNGVVWAPLASGHMASFDRSKCKGPLNGPTATGRHCPEGWTLYPLPGPQFKGLADSGSAEASYYTWVDQFDTFGLGKNIPMATGNESDALFVLKDGKWITLRVPYPMGFYAKAMDGRFDDPKGGWKGHGLWATYGTRTPFHVEGGKGTTSKVVHIQLRPSPLTD